jgi:Cu+-exporting ATPase
MTFFIFLAIAIYDLWSVIDPLPNSTCAHCTEPLPPTPILFQEKAFCCQACRDVFRILNEGGLQAYYSQPDRSSNRPSSGRYLWMDETEAAQQIWKYQSPEKNRAQWQLPGMHCGSCIWLLERLPALHPGILSAEANLSNRRLDLWVNPSKINASEVANLLSSLGYPPEIDSQNAPAAPQNRRLTLQIGLAGFGLGNIMLLSFPEYLGFEAHTQPILHAAFQWLSWIISLPVLFYSGIDYFKTAWASIKQRHMHIDIPLALGMLVLFVQSTYAILSHNPKGIYLDSLAGLVFFLLLAKWYQGKLFHALRFEKDHSSYLPMSVLKVVDNQEIETPVSKLKIGDTIKLYPNEILPADAILLNQATDMDYSFVTGESAPVPCTTGTQMFAGGRNCGHAALLSLTAPSDQSYLVKLWNQGKDRQAHHQYQRLTDKMSGRFIAMVLLVAAATGTIWSLQGGTRWIEIVASILIVACPCALALSAPFATGNMARLLARIQFYVREPLVIEQLATCNTFVLDKTGTLTDAQSAQAHWQGAPLSSEHMNVLFAMTYQSNHPVAKAIQKSIAQPKVLPQLHVKELPGKGLTACLKGQHFRLGNPNWIEGANPISNLDSAPTLFEVEGRILGGFVLNHALKPSLEIMGQHLAQMGEVHVASGDSNKDKLRLQALLGKTWNFHFQLKPNQKQELVLNLKEKNGPVCFAGDGLNDGPAMNAALVGVAVTNTMNGFFPACDAMMQGERMHELPMAIQLSRKTKKIIKECFSISLVYNSSGIAIAAAGFMSPVVAAILMPLSSITVVAWAMGRTWWEFRQANQQQQTCRPTQLVQENLLGTFYHNV